MENNIELRDLFAAQLMSGKADDLYSAEHRVNVNKGNGTEHWEHVTADEATQNRIKQAAKMSYRIADALLEARKMEHKHQK